MARNQERQFSERENLLPQDLGQSPYETEERLPAWAAHPKRDGSQGEADPASGTVHQGKAQESALPEENQEDSEIRRPLFTPHDQERAEDAWEKEAKKVESASERRFKAVHEKSESTEEKKPRPDKKDGKKAPSKKNSKKKKKKKNQTDDDRRSFIKSLVIIAICAVLFLGVALMVVSNFVSHPLLNVPRQMITSVITPVQSFFSSITGNVVDYLRTLKIRGNLEYEYEQLTILLDDYANQIAENEELRRINEELYALLDEQERNREMLPVAATVIGTDSSNYFSSLTLDVGSNSGVGEYMAVVAQGGLVGVTYDVEPDKCQVRCIISSDCTVAALIQSSRDQGSVKGTLGVNGEAMCRMYYLPDNSLPRPGDVVVTSGVGLEFPKGIPIGYIRESTRGMEENKSYVVLEPVVDFQHLEYVTVYRYKPAYTETAQARDNASALELEPMSTVRPVPTWQVGSVSDFIFAPTATPNGMTPAPSPEASLSPESTPEGQTPSPTATLDPEATPVPENLEYKTASDAAITPTPSPRPTPTPTPTPEPTQDPGAMTVEEEE